MRAAFPLALSVVFLASLTCAHGADSGLRPDQMPSAPFPTVPSPYPADPGLLINSAPHQGASPLGIALVEETLYVVGLFDGETHLYDLDLNHVGLLPSPGGNNTTSGLAYTPGDALLRWVAYTNHMMYVTDLNGVVMEMLVMESPAGGNMTGLDLDDTTSTLWSDDIVNDISGCRLSRWQDHCRA